MVNSEKKIDFQFAPVITRARQNNDFLVTEVFAVSLRVEYGKHI